MTTYSSKPAVVPMPADAVYERVSDIESFESRIKELPEDVRAKMGEVRFTHDAIIINSAPVGEMTLNVSERVPGKRIAFSVANAPVPLVMAINLAAKDDSSTEVVTAIDVEMPAVLRPIVGPKLQQAAEKFGEMIKNIAVL
ncbi:MAG: hypothetical protein NC127_02445 [Muribaculum sp.]|nr:hypothetical protein [Muribaculum sp.]